jgi:ankyrin repeat protein
MAQLPLGRGAEIEAKNVTGETALHIAASHRQKEVLQLLLDRGADPEEKNNSRQIALYIAVSAGQKER